MNNSLAALNNYLFEQIELLNDEDLKGDELDKVLKKTEAINRLADSIIKNADTQIKAIKLVVDSGATMEQVPQALLETKA